MSGCLGPWKEIWQPVLEKLATAGLCIEMNIFSCICAKFPNRKIDLENVSKYKMQMLKTRKLYLKQNSTRWLKIKQKSQIHQEMLTESWGKILISEKKNSRPKAHGIRTAAWMSLLPMHHHKLVSYSSYLFPKPFQLICSSYHFFRVQMPNGSVLFIFPDQAESALL